MSSTHPTVSIILSLVLSMFAMPTSAEDSNNKKADHTFGRLQSHKPNLLSYAHDDNDVMKMTLSTQRKNLKGRS